MQRFLALILLLWVTEWVDAPTSRPQVAMDPCGILTFEYVVSDEYRESGGCDRSIKGDVDGNGVVDVRDLLLILSAWGLVDMRGCCHIDPNSDGVVNVLDLMILLWDWGRSTAEKKGIEGANPGFSE